MGQRLSLHQLLKDALGSSNVYFQPPTTTKIVYPAIVYQLDSEQVEHADNRIYSMYDRYQITLIDPNPDTTVRKKLLEIPLTRFDRFYVSANLNHFAFLTFF